jgi:hypothetical protein
VSSHDDHHPMAKGPVLMPAMNIMTPMKIMTTMIIMMDDQLHSVRSDAL